MEIERGVDRFVNLIHDARDRAIDHSSRNGPVQNHPHYVVDVGLDALLFALDDLQRQIDELKEEAR